MITQMCEKSDKRLRRVPRVSWRFSWLVDCAESSSFFKIVFGKCSKHLETFAFENQIFSSKYEHLERYPFGQIMDTL